jgi:hypothetical protein
VFSNTHMRNNLFLGIDAPDRVVFRFSNATSYSSFDYNGYRLNPKAKDQFQWVAPRAGLLRDYDVDRTKGQRFGSLGDLRLATGQEAHGVEVDYDVFRKLQAPDAGKPHAIYEARELDFQLAAGGKAVDAGVLVPNVNDDFMGRAPDLGAYEIGRALPLYGPRN